jgi:hypothetical protein
MGGTMTSAMPAPAGPPDPVAAALLREVRALFHARGAERLPTEEVVAALAAGGRSITATRLTRTLKPLGAAPRQFRVEGRVRWGYHLNDLPAVPAEGRDAPKETEAVALPTAAAPAPSAEVVADDALAAQREWNWYLALRAWR